MATIHKRKLGSGEMVWELCHGSGKERIRMVAGRTQEEAQEVLNQFKRQLGLHGTAPKTESVVGVVSLYGEFLRTNRRPRTVTRYLRVLRTFVECFLARRYSEVQLIRQIRPLHVEEFKRMRSEGLIEPIADPKDSARELELRLAIKGKVGTTKGQPKERGKFGWLGRHGIRRRVSQRTVNYELRVLFTFFLWAIKRNLLFLNPVATIERFRLPKRALPKFMTAGDLKKFFAACDESDRRLFMSILLSGMRKGEVEHLTWSDVSFELGVIFIQEKPELGWKPKTDERIIPISPMLREVLLLQHTHRRSDTLVFANQSGNRDTHILERLKSICGRARIKSSTVHALRHSFGAHLRMAGANLADIGDLLGHKDLATTQIYAKVQQDHLRSVASKLKTLVGEVVDTNDTPKALTDGSEESNKTN